MQQIYYPKRSDLFQMIRKCIYAQCRNKNDIKNLTIEIPKRGGYDGKFEVEIFNDRAYFIANFHKEDITRFPQRIKHTALVLKEAGNLGKYLISHQNGTIIIERSENVNKNDLVRRSWSDRELELIVDSYISMLIKDIRSEKYNKSKNREKLRPKLSDRSNGSIEYKHQNISAVLNDVGFPYISGYKPLFNYQNKLIDIVKSKLNHIGDDLPYLVNDLVANSIKSSGDLTKRIEVVDPPNLKKQRGNFLEQITFGKDNKNDYPTIESKNIEFGKEGEKLVLNYEKERLSKLGLPVSKLIWVSEDRGDNEGYDILSKNGDRSDRFIEVKTTTQGIDFPFYISAREVEFSRRNAENYYLYRVFNLKTHPKFYVLNGFVSDRFELVPTQYKAFS